MLQQKRRIQKRVCRGRHALNQHESERTKRGRNDLKSTFHINQHASGLNKMLKGESKQTVHVFVCFSSGFERFLSSFVSFCSQALLHGNLLQLRYLHNVILYGVGDQFCP